MQIKLEHLTKRFPNRNKKIKEDVIAVNDFDLTLPDGKLIGLLGPSGCGKSTALNLICGLLAPSEGRIFFDDDDVTDIPAERRGVGLVFQSYALYPHLTVERNIRYPLENLRGDKKLTKEQMAAKVHEAAKLVQIDELLERKPNELSGGQQQRVAIARALVKTPRVLLLDEPLSNLDARLRLQTREEIRRIQKETGITTIFVTHDQDEAMSISDTIIVMNAGVIQQVDKPQSVYDDPVNLFVAKFLGTPAINVFDGIVTDGVLKIGKDNVMTVGGVRNGPVSVGIRPEGFTPDANGPFICNLDRVEVMGRDISVVSTHEGSESAVIRSIISSEHVKNIKGDTVRFSIKPEKLHIFDRETGERLYFEAVTGGN